MAGSAVATVATGAGPGVMPAQVLGGPIWWYFFGVYLLAIALAAFVLMDSLRSARAPRFAELPESRLLYAIASGVYLAFVLGVWIRGVPRVVSVVPVVLTPFSLGLSVAYLLRVVFPKPAATASDAGLADAGGGSDAPGNADLPPKDPS